MQAPDRRPRLFLRRTASERSPEAYSAQGGDFGRASGAIRGEAKMSTGQVTRRAALGGFSAVFFAACRRGPAGRAGARALRPAAFVSTSRRSGRTPANRPRTGSRRRFPPRSPRRSPPSDTTGRASRCASTTSFWGRTAAASDPRDRRLTRWSGPSTEGGVERPLRATSNYYPMASDAAMIEQSNYYRVLRLSQAFAYWVARGY